MSWTALRQVWDEDVRMQLSEFWRDILTIEVEFSGKEGLRMREVHMEGVFDIMFLHLHVLEWAADE